MIDLDTLAMQSEARAEAMSYSARDIALRSAQGAYQARCILSGALLPPPGRWRGRYVLRTGHLLARLRADPRIRVGVDKHTEPPALRITLA